jgi:tRNA pseudouridine55 synthase
MATGVLPVCLGAATRVVEYLVDASKAYTAQVRLGVTTNTYDREGEVTRTADASTVTRAAVEAALAAFRGEIEQRPPAYSALKRNGVPLYRLARAGRAVEVPPRPVTIYQLQLAGWDPPVATLTIECSKGTYIRSLAHDLGIALGIGGSLEALRRTRVGSFTADRAMDIDSPSHEIETGTWMQRLFAPDEVLLDWPAAIVGSKNEAHLRHGRPATFDASAAARARCRAYSLEGDFLAVLRRDGETWRAEKVFAT